MPAALMAATERSSAHHLIQFLVDRPLKTFVLVVLAWIGVRLANRAISRFVSRDSDSHRVPISDCGLRIVLIEKSFINWKSEIRNP